jgi:tetratricopeptide (TPR) repeat protein
MVVALASALLLAPVVTGSAQVVNELSRRQAIEHYVRGQELMSAERYEQAAEAFGEAVVLNPLLAEAHYGRGQAYMALRRYASAIQAFLGARGTYEKLAAMAQRDAAERSRLETDELHDVRDALRRVQNSQVDVNALTLARLRQRLEELETLRRGTRVGGVFRVPAEVFLALGSAYYRNGQVADAEREWHEAVSIDASLGEAHNNLAVLYMQTGRKTLAEDALRAAERAGHRVHPQLKTDIQKMTASTSR